VKGREDDREQGCYGKGVELHWCPWWWGEVASEGSTMTPGGRAGLGISQ